jgi:HEAT repeat protein
MAALHDPDDHVRAAAAEAAGDLGERSAGPILLACLVEEPDEDVTRALVAALGVLREEGAVPKLAELARFVSGVFQRRAVAVRVAAVHALAAIDTPDARAQLERHRDDSVPEVRAAVLQSVS